MDIISKQFIYSGNAMKCKDLEFKYLYCYQNIASSLAAKLILLFFLVIAPALCLHACSKQSTADSTAVLPDSSQATNYQVADETPGQLFSQEQVLQAQSQRAKKVEVLFSARVKRLLADDTRGLPHQQFLLQLDNGSTVKVAHDTKYAPRVPIRAGDILTIKGEYIWNQKGGVVHWTHRSDTPRHEGGYIDFAGQRYQ